MLRKSLFVTISALVLSLGASTAYAATWTNAQTLSVFYIREMSGVSRLEVITAGTWGGGCASNVVVREGNDAVQDHYVSTVLAAYLAGRRIKVYTDATCKFTRMQME